MDIAALLPHPEPVRLLDRVIGVSANRLWASFTPSAGHWYADAAGSMSSAVGVEALAQASAALFTALALSDNSDATPRAGMLVANQRYRCEAGRFTAGSALLVSVTAESSLDSVQAGFGVLVRFSGSISALPPQLPTSQPAFMSPDMSPDPELIAVCDQALASAIAQASFSVYLPPLPAQTLDEQLT